MKKTFFAARAFALVLAMLTVLGMLSSCNGDGKPTDTDDAGATNAPAIEAPAPEKPTAPSLEEVEIVRNADGTTEYRDICVALKEYFGETLGVKVTLTSDYSYTYEKKDGKLDIFVGNPLGVDIVTRAKEKATDTNVVFLREDDQFVVYAKNDQLLRLGIQSFLADAVKDNVFSIPKSYADYQYDLSDCLREGWKLPFPSYDGGALDQTLYSAGGGLYETQESDVSWLQLVKDTTEGEYLNYLDKLDEMGYKCTFSNTIDGNLYNNYYDHLGNNIYVYYMCEMNAETGTVRAIIDNSSVSMEEFSYVTDPGEESTFYMFNHNNTSENLFLIHSADNKWIVFDGGTEDTEHKFARSLYEFMAERSDLGEGEKVVISCWYISHTDGDHYQGFKQMVDDYHDKIVIERLLGNVPDFERSAPHNSHRTKYRQLLTTINRYFPDAMYLKAHDGMVLQLADVEITVLLTQEDVVDYWVNNLEIFRSTWRNWWSYYTDEAGYPQDGRGSAKDLEYCLAYKKYDYNNSSMLTKVDLNGMTILELGDGFRADQWLLPYYTVDTLNSDVIVAAHHFYNTELHPFYIECAAQGQSLCFLVPCMDYNTNHSVNLDYATNRNFAKDTVYNSLKQEKNQFYIEAATDKIYGIRKVNGLVTVTETVDAKFSNIGKLDKYANP